MNDTSMTTKKVKEINKNKVYRFMYDSRNTCKLQITQQLQMGLSTVTQNLRLLEEDGLICKNGFYESTGGRKADALQIVPEARLSIGVAVLQHMLHVVVTDLYGRLINGSIFPLPFSHRPEYYQKVGYSILSFIAQHNLNPDRILGVSIAGQGIISQDGTAVDYGPLLHNEDVLLSHFQDHIPFPCRLEHDSKAAAQLELWEHPQVTDGVVLLLNRNLGGALVTGGQVQNGTHMRSGILEHMTIQPNGKPCYCGQRGCLEAYCSVNSLEARAGMDIHQFFQKLEEKDPGYMAIWEEYLDHLAQAIRTISLIVDGTYLFSGYLAPYFKDSYVLMLLERINANSAFPLDRSQIIVGSSGQFTQAVGASLFYIKEFLQQV